MLATLAAWVMLMVAVVYWRMFHAWCVGSFFKFMLHDAPILVAVLIVALSAEGLLLRKVRQVSRNRRGGDLFPR